MIDETKLPEGVGLLLSLLDAGAVSHERMANEPIDDTLALMHHALARNMFVAATSAGIAVLHHPETQQEDLMFVIANMGRLNSARIMQEAQRLLDTRRKKG